MRGRKLLVAVLLSTAGVAHAGDKPLYQAAPGWVKAAPAPDPKRTAESDPMIVLFDEQARIADGQVWTYFDQAQRVVSAQMLSNVGTVTLPWQPDAGDLIIHRVEIIRGGERIDLVAAGQRFQVLRREQQLEQWQINGTLTASLAVEGLRVGDVLRLSYSTTHKDAALQGNAQAFLPLFADPMRAQFARARLSWPKSSKLGWKVHMAGNAAKPVTEGDDQLIDIAMPLAKQPEIPADAPPRFKPMTLIEASSYADWQAVSKVMAPLYRTEGLIAAGSPLAAEVAKIRDKSPDARTRAALALRLVQDDVRYLFVGMDGGSYTPQAPAETWSRRYGDCKAKTLLLLALLRALDIQAEPVLANTEAGDVVPARLPAPGAFNHVLVHATIDGQSLWLDGTSSGARIADLGDVPPFRNVLPVRPDGAALMALPVRAPGRPTFEADIDMDQRAGLDLPTPFTIQLLVRGPLAEAIHAGSGQATKEQLDQMATSFASGFLSDSLIADRSIAYDAESASATIRIRGIAGSPWHREDGRLRAVLDKTISSLSFEPDRARPEWQDIPVAVNENGSAVARWRIRLPAGKGFTFDGDQTLPATLAGRALSRKVTLGEGELRIEDRSSPDLAEVAPAKVAETKAQVALAKTRLLTALAPENTAPRWKTVMEAKRSGALKPLLDVYAAAIAANPKEVEPWSSRANFHAGIWEWKAALADLDHAIGIQPSVALYSQRAGIKSAMGDDKGALADAQAAKTLDPGDSGVASLLATYTANAGQPDAAVQMAAERVARGGSERNGFVALQAQLLGDSGHAADAVAVLDPVIAKAPGNAMLLNSRCWIKGTGNIGLDGALKDCTKAIELAEQPASILDSRAMVYFRMGRMDDALADLNAALDVAPLQSSSLFLRGVIRGKTGDKAAAEDLAAARMIWPRVDGDYARFGIKP
ncbi:DUF3857 domain-containing protein [Sphingomonas sp. R1]|uniref:DUF3857 domain-containing protein n=1 Tax=Sphingomonas sp. R1 TaxID=399176 RepID=UPI0022254FD7|nr:DUF3857 domain-containing protein [Sphingomonas sp. R1]UYY79135.1 DUF3857 domain-containing protein [Sphingomonas sp. R1]